MEKKYTLAPSILSANFLNLEKDLWEVMDSGVEILHVDVMDGVFVPNISFGMPIIKQVREKFTGIMDVHLMIVEPRRYISKMKELGADILTVHIEATHNIEETLKEIKNNKMKAGISIKPNTNVEAVYPLIRKNLVDLVLIMSVEPGFGGQGFIEDSLNKVRALRKFIDCNNYNTLIEIDGGIKEENIKKVRDGGVDILVAGSSVFNKNIKESISSLYKAMSI